MHRFPKTQSFSSFAQTRITKRNLYLLTPQAMMMRWSFHIIIQIILQVMGRSINQGQCYPSLCARVQRFAPLAKRRTSRAGAASFHAFHQSLPRYEDQSIPEYIPLWVHCIQQHLQDRSNLWKKGFRYRVLFMHERVSMEQGTPCKPIHIERKRFLRRLSSFSIFFHCS